ncbi:MAG: succinate dehydrogenase cytochrome b subunit [Desulfobacteraceae bacterium]|jgi:succinate dehydrogenase / fumarate reductase cytochrome b subunit
MNWLINTIKSSVGKKILMSVTGLCFCGFLAAHLGGNLTIYGGKEMFNSYAEHLHALGVLLTFAEWGLLISAVIHVLTGVTLFYQNYKARPVRYRVNKSGGGRTIGSRTMPYTGIILLAFVVFHLVHFHFVDKTDTTIFTIVSEAFGNPLYVMLYIAAMVVAAVHVSHGFWSAFQTLGANHPKYMPFIRTVSLVFALVVGIGFGVLPIFISISA